MERNNERDKILDPRFSETLWFKQNTFFSLLINLPTQNGY